MLATLTAAAPTRAIEPAAAGAAAAGAAASAPTGTSAPDAGLRRPIPKAAGVTVPAIGLGTWLTFNVDPADGQAIAQRGEVLARFFAAGGGMVDSSPMYGHAEWLLGELLRGTPAQGRMVSATKVWTPFAGLGPGQFERSLELWRLPRLDVALVHNLLNWRAHLPMLRERQARGELRWVGVSTSHGRAHDEVAALLRSEPIEVLQLSYSLADASAEPLLELAAERGVAVVVNRPFDGGWLFDRVRGTPVPPWAREALGCEAWSQVFLKWILGHPAVTCAIPATSRVEHLRQNMAAARGSMPDAALRRRMGADVAAL